MRIVFLGTPEVAVRPLRALVAAGHDVALVVSQPDRKRGRGGALLPSPVKATATELGLPTTDVVDDAVGTGATLGVVVAYGRLIRPHVLAAVPMVNIHFSLLPRWRGAAPVERAILAGDATTGVCVMALEEGLDTGPIYGEEEVVIGPDDTADDLRGVLVELGTAMLVELLSGPLPTPRPQEGQPTYAAKLAPADHHLDWRRPALDLHRVVRVGQAWTTFRGSRLKVHRTRMAGDGQGPSGTRSGARVPPAGVLDPVTLVVGTGEGGLQLVEVQPEGRPVQTAGAWRNGARLDEGARLGG
ncbi:MAG: methionyl-tRNA formyltransferase [Actinomycetota bacterium]|nr:methionyl-tRNA formyltransferase [Actinomycetota bacterium]